MVWEKHYNETPMTQLDWYTNNADKDIIEAIKKYCEPKGSLLDIGAGPGTMARAFQQMGYNVTATDISDTAIEMAKKRLGALSESITFLVDDITKTKIAGHFNIIHDRGCFHVLDGDQRLRYVENVNRLLEPGGMLLLKTFSIKETTIEGGPNRYDPQTLAGFFTDTFDVLVCVDSTIPGTLEKDPRALFIALRKIV